MHGRRRAVIGQKDDRRRRQQTEAYRAELELRSMSPRKATIANRCGLLLLLRERMSPHLDDAWRMAAAPAGRAGAMHDPQRIKDDHHRGVSTRRRPVAVVVAWSGVLVD